MSSNPMSQRETWDALADAYDEETAPFLAGYATDALRLAEVTRGESVLDVASGPGTLALHAAAYARVTAVDFAPAMVDRLKAAAVAAGVQVDARVADGMDLPFEDQQFDAGFSMFGLMFFPERDRGFRELHRVLRPGGRAVVSSWPRVDDTSEMARFFGAFFPDAPVVPHHGPPLGDLALLEQEMSQAGFRQITVTTVTHALEAHSTAALCASSLRGNVAVRLYADRLDAPQRRAYEESTLERLRRAFGDGPIRVEMPAYLALAARAV